MPQWKATIPEPDCWHLFNFIRSLINPDIA